MYIAGVQEQNTQSSCAFHPTCCRSVPRIFLTTPHATTALGLPHGQGGSVCTHENSQPANSYKPREIERIVITSTVALEDAINSVNPFYEQGMSSARWQIQRNATAHQA